jgi:adenosylhomocysteine nucleosidase
VSVLAVTGLAREARIVAGECVVCVCGGGDSTTLRDKIARAIGPETRAIISIGIAGALSADLKVSDCVVAVGVMSGAETYRTDPTWTRQLQAVLRNSKSGMIAGADAILADAAAKAALRAAAVGALVVDMESHVAARAAAARGLPFAAVRVVSDDSVRTLPPAARVAMKADGGIALGAVARSLLAQPAQIPALIRTALESEAAFRTLLRCRDLLGLGLACPYLG